jgi:hypothetical protein
MAGESCRNASGEEECQVVDGGGQSCTDRVQRSLAFMMAR